MSVLVSISVAEASKKSVGTEAEYDRPLYYGCYKKETQMNFLANPVLATTVLKVRKAGIGTVILRLFH